MREPELVAHRLDELDRHDGGAGDAEAERRQVVLGAARDRRAASGTAWAGPGSTLMRSAAMRSITAPASKTGSGTTVAPAIRQARMPAL